MLLLPTIVFGQSGEGYINYKSYKTHYGNSSSSTYNGVTYSGISDNIAELVATLDVNQPGTTLHASGETLAYSTYAFTLGRPPRWSSERYGARWEGWIQPQVTGTYTFALQSDDASAFYLNDDLKLFRPCCGYTSVNVTLNANQWYKLEVLFQEYTGGDYMYFTYSPPNHASTYYVGQDATTLKVTNQEPDTTPSPSVDLDLEFNSQMAPEEFRFRVYYDGTSAQDGTEWLNTSTMNSSYYLDDDGSKDITDYLNLVKIADGKKATTTGGSVEWCVVYDYDSTNKRYRIGIDKREFPTTIAAQDVKQLQLFDVWNGDVTFKSDDGTWGEYYIYTDTELDFTNSTFSSYIRDANGFYGMRAEFSFIDVEVYKGHKVGFMNPSLEVDGWTAGEFIDDYVTVADVVSAFNELAGGGINGGFKGDLTGVQLQFADVNGDKKFDFQDTYKLLKFLQGTENLVTNNSLGEIMRLVPQAEYDGTTTSNWTTQTTYSPTTSLLFDLKDEAQTFMYKVGFLGDVNLSHSAPHVEIQLGGTARIMSTRYSSTQKDNSLEVNLDIEKTEEHIIVTLDLPQNNFNLVGSEFRIGFDNTRLEYDKLETNSTMNTFDAKRETYLKIGSISVDGSMNLNSGVQYKIYFKPLQTFDSTLGLVSVKKSEVVDGTAKQIGIIIK